MYCNLNSINHVRLANEKFNLYRGLNQEIKKICKSKVKALVSKNILIIALR